MPAPRTILLTGITGFIARHCAVQMLNAGHSLRATLRDPAKGDALRADLRPHLTDPAALDRLTLHKADLTADEGWSQAAAGADVQVHTASPFPIAQPKNADDLIRPAVDGTLRALRAAHAAGITRVVLTSSCVAILQDGRRTEHTEADWCDPKSPTATPYALSKTLAERAAWDFASANALALTTVNPGLVLGPPIGAEAGSSVSVIRRLLSGKDPMQPPIGLPVVDVRDVARMHVKAVEDPGLAGSRFIASAGSLSFVEMAQILRTAYPDRRIARHVAPAWMIRLMAPFDAEIRTILPKLGYVETVSNAQAVSRMDMRFIPPAEALLATARWVMR
jgi:dihydroflavonol-4-reductase